MRTYKNLVFNERTINEDTSLRFYSRMIFKK